jgi:hypothetical protein
LGLFADREFDKGSVITAFGGRLVDHKQALKLRLQGKSSHLAPHTRGLSVVLSPTVPQEGQYGAQFANHMAQKEKRNAKLVILESRDSMRRWPFLVAIDKIQRGDEVFYMYGTGAFQSDHVTADTAQSSTKPHLA